MMAVCGDDEDDYYVNFSFSLMMLVVERWSSYLAQTLKPLELLLGKILNSKSQWSITQLKYLLFALKHYKCSVAISIIFTTNMTIIIIIRKFLMCTW